MIIYRKMLLAFGLGAAFLLPGTAYAGPGSTEEELVVSEAELARLSDNVLEFDEIEARIEGYNSTYGNTKESIIDQTLNLDAARDLAADASELMDEAREIKEDDRVLYDEYRSMVRAMRKEAQHLSNKELSNSMKLTLRQVRSNLVKVVQGLMIQYQSTAANADTAAKGVELAEANLRMQQNLLAQGYGSQAEVMAAEQSLLSARNQQQQLLSGLQILRQNIQILLGWKSGDNVEFARVPDPDLALIDAMNPEADLQSAIGANYTLHSEKSTSVRGAVRRRNKARSVDVSEQKIAATLQKMHSDVLSKREAFAAAESTLAAAQIDMDAAERRHSLGMSGNLEYLNAQLSFLSARAAREGAAMSLVQAMLDYDWAVHGLIADSAMVQ